MGTTRLQLYNDALQLCGEPKLASLTENRRQRYELDQVWDGSSGIGGWIDAVLEMGQWQFAERSIEISADPDVDTSFGYANAFGKPTDWISTLGVCSDERFNTPLVQYRDSTDYWFADIDPIYVRYVSNDSAYGGDLARWPQSFCAFAAAYGASKIVLALSSDKNKAGMILQPKTGILAQALSLAKSRAAMTQPTRMPPESGWNAARSGRAGRRGPMGDGGTTNTLTG